MRGCWPIRRAVLPADRFLEIEYETLIAEPEQTTRRMIAFLGLEWDDACLHPERNPRQVKTASKWQARQAIYASALERWRRYEPFLGPFRALLPSPAADDAATRCRPSLATGGRAMSGPIGAAVPPGRNDPCPCGSGRKYKLCCGAADRRPRKRRPVATPGAAARRSSGSRPAERGGPDARGRQRRLRSLYIDPLVGLRLPGDFPCAGRRPTPRRQVEMAERHRERAARLLQTGQAAAAIAALRQATDLEADNAELWHALGRALLDVGQFTEAEASFKLAITQKDDFAAAQFDLGVAIDRQGRTFDAIVAFRRAVELSRNSSRVIAGSRNSSSRQATSRPRSNRLRPEGWRRRRDRVGTARQGWAWLLEGDFHQAEVRLRQGLADNPTSAPLHKLLGEVLASLGRFDEAIAAYDSALETDPLQVDAHLGRFRPASAARRSAAAGADAVDPSGGQNHRGAPDASSFRHRQDARRSG